MANPYDCFLWELIFLFIIVCYIVVKEVVILGHDQLMIVVAHRIFSSLIIHEGVVNDF